MPNGKRQKKIDLRERSNSFSKTGGDFLSCDIANLVSFIILFCLACTISYSREQVNILSAKIAGQDEERKNAQEQLRESVRSCYYTILFSLLTCIISCV